MRTPRKVVVTGAAGVLGRYAPEAFSEWDVVLTHKHKDDGCLLLDVRDPDAAMRVISDAQPDLVLHLAAVTDVDGCEQEPDRAYHTNVIGTQNVALACQANEVPMAYVSTASVFRGDKHDPYTELDDPRPVNVYGRSKLAGETIVASLLRRYYTIRTCWIVGGGVKDRRFVGKLAERIQQGQRELRVVNDKFGSPTYARDLMHGIRRLVETGYYGLYHMANAGSGSRYDVAMLVREALNRPDVSIVPVSSAYFPLPAPRGRSECLRNLKLDLLPGLNVMRPWQEAIREYVSAELCRASSLRMPQPS